MKSAPIPCFGFKLVGGDIFRCEWTSTDAYRIACFSRYDDWAGCSATTHAHAFTDNDTGSRISGKSNAEPHCHSNPFCNPDTNVQPHAYCNPDSHSNTDSV